MVKKKKPSSGSGSDKGGEVVNTERNKIYASSSNKSRGKEAPTVVPESTAFEPVAEVLQIKGI